MRFDVVVCYAQTEEGALTTDIWKGFCPTESVKALNQGDTKMEVKIPGIILDVKYNVV